MAVRERDSQTRDDEQISARPSTANVEAQRRFALDCANGTHGARLSAEDVRISPEAASAPPSDRSLTSLSRTVRVLNIPFTAIAEELVESLESSIGLGTVYACKIHTEKFNWKSKGFGFVQFDTEAAASLSIELARKCKLKLQNSILQISLEEKDIIDRPQICFQGSSLHLGLLTKCEFNTFWSIESLITVELDYVKGKLAFIFENVRAATRHKLSWRLSSLELCGAQIQTVPSQKTLLLLQTKFAPKIQRMLKANGLKRTKVFVGDRFTFFRENPNDQEHSWCRCTDFTEKGYIGKSSWYCLEIPAAEKSLYNVATKELCKIHAFEELGDITMNLGKLTDPMQERITKKLSFSGLDDSLTQVKRFIVTPTKEYFLGSEIEVSNRVTRHFKDNIENFMRVRFLDEDMSSLSSRALEISPDKFLEMRIRSERTDIYRRIQKILKDGIMFEGKKYEFLAFSSSQLREHSVWMFAPHQTTTCDSIRSWIGDFTTFRNVASCAARMGQCFSASKQGPHVLKDDIDEIPDIEILDGCVKYCFSDGIGKISAIFAAEVARHCGIEVQEMLAPSAYQIRYGGYKGVVAIDLASSCKLSLRPSMKKFQSKLTEFDVLDWTRFLPCYLNRQVITLLSTLGVDDNVFESMQKERISSLDKVMLNRENALNLLQLSCSGVYHNITIQMLLAGYNPSEEPFLLRMLRAFKLAQIHQIWKKSRILVQKGRVLMGCLDEYGFLNYGQVFVKVSSPGNRASVIRGTVVVTKNPCLHPGDIRVLEAVDQPNLEHMVDCIVFPQKGNRPHPNECSGSDLDGDLYFVAWEERLVPPKVEAPMDYHPSNSIALDHTPTLQEIQTYFVDYMSNDSLGTIANAHVVFADQEPEKARSEKCIKLAELSSVAVDFPKTGVSAMLPRYLRPQSYPEFMEKSEKKTYTSSSVIGKLYRAAKEAVSPDSLTMFEEKLNEYYDNDLVVPGFEEHLERSSVYKKLYIKRLSALMEFYGVQSEAEMLTGFFSELRPTFSNASKKVEDRIQDAVQALKVKAKSWFKDMQNGDDPKQRYTIASAWYHVTYYPQLCGKQGTFSDQSDLLSFPWVNYDELLQIKRFAKLCRAQSH